MARSCDRRRHPVRSDQAMMCWLDPLPFLKDGEIGFNVIAKVKTGFRKSKTFLLQIANKPTIAIASLLIP